MSDDEKILLGAWLMGDNLNDMGEFEESDFSRPDVFRLLKEGAGNMEISRKLGIHISEIMEWRSMYFPYLYEEAAKEWQKNKILRQIAEVTSEKDLSVIAEKIDRLLTIGQTVRPETNLAKKFEEAIKARQNQRVVCYGIESLDGLTLGLHRTELTTIGARPAVGKSAFALQIALSVVEQGQKVLYFPLEMSTEQTLERIAAMNGYTDMASLRTGRGLNKEKFNQVLGQISALELSGRFKIYEGENDLNHITAAVKREKPFLIVVDQLTQLRCNRRFNSKREQFSYMTTELKRLAMKEKIAVILLAQINRTGDDTSPTMAQLKESGSIEEDSDNVILLHRVPEENWTHPEKWTNGKVPYAIKLAKQRSGETGDFSAIFYKQNLKFFSM